MEQKKYFFAVDLGATSGRTIVGDITNGRLSQEEVTRFPNNLIEQGGHYYWESGALGTYAVFNQSSTLAVGSKAPNAWGLYDTIGNVWEFCRDRSGLGNMADISDPFIPYDNGASLRVRGSGTYSSNTVRYFYASFRNYAGADWSSSTCGFRVAYIAK